MIRNLSIIICALGLSGCISATRPCPGFGTALADQWSTALNVSDVVTYVSNTGSTVKLKLSAREDSEPYEGRGSNGSDEVTCNSYSDRLYTIENSNVAMRVLLEQSQFKDPSLKAEQWFYIEIKPESLEGERVPGYRYGISLGLDARQPYSNTFEPENDPSADIVARRFIENLQVGDNTYLYSIELKYSNVTPLSNAVTNSNSFAGITRMILAEDGGLVQFELLNGKIYSRI